LFYTGKENLVHSLPSKDLEKAIDALDWYHTIDLGNGILTPGFYDHRAYLEYYGLPDDLTGKTVLDVGAASGFFSFELERRGAQVTAVDLPAWFDHDFGPCYQPDRTADSGLKYLKEPFSFAKRVLNSQARKIEKSIYDLDPATDGVYDLVFCGSLLLHLTDPTRALWRLKQMTRGLVIIAKAIHVDDNREPVALFTGYHQGDVWWLPNRLCFERMLSSAGFAGWKWFSEFRLDYRDGRPGFYHAVIHAWTDQIPEWIDQTIYSTCPPPNHPPLDERDAEIARLQTLVQGYEQGRFIRFMAWLKRIWKQIKKK
jgi:SAM-dependent methyltransferase